jgi:uncharacterized protein YfdQ (DUF2303 family)
MSTDDNTTELAAAALPPAAEHLHLDTTAIGKIGALSLAGAAIREHGDAVFAVVPADYKLTNITPEIEAAALAPRRKTGTVQLAAVESFATFVTQQGDVDNTYIYADIDSRMLVAVMNDHSIGDNAGRRDFRAVYQAEYSREFANWMSNNGKHMDQEQFAIFLEDNIADIAPPADGSNEPSGDTLLAVALTLQAKTEVDFKSHKRLDNGQVQLTYSEETTARAGADSSLEIPREFAIGLRLFKHGEGFKIRARLKYRLGSGKLKFWYELDRPQNAVEAAFQTYVDAAKGSGYTVLMGKP